MKKFGKLLKKYGFFAATGTICIGALVAIFMMPNHDGNVSKEPNAYAKNLTADSQDITASNPTDQITILDEDDLDTTDKVTGAENVSDKVFTEESSETAATMPVENVDKQNADKKDTTDKKEADKKETPKEASKDTKTVAVNDEKKDTSKEKKADATNKETQSKDTKTEQAKDTKTVADTDKVATTDEVAKADDITTETFESTTVSTEEPFFADGDTFAWPVDGNVVVPYTDESTKHWFSETLNQTMRTFGICISADAGTEVKAVAKGTVIAADEDSTKLVSDNMPNVGSLMVIDHGNGYLSYYGFQNGQMNMDLVGQVVNTGDVLGTVGSPKGAFTSLGDNIYLQVLHNGEVVNPLNYLADKNVKADGVDLGFAAN